MSTKDTLLPKPARLPAVPARVNQARSFTGTAGAQKAQQWSFGSIR